MAELNLRFDVSFGARSARCMMAAVMILMAVQDLASESVSLTTYYPAPSGVYAQMIVTNNATLARDGGSVAVGTASSPAQLNVNGTANISGSVGIGTPTPQALLDVNGGSVFRGALTIPTGAGNGYVLTSNSQGAATWQPPKSGHGVLDITTVYVYSDCNNPVVPKGAGCPSGYTQIMGMHVGAGGDCNPNYTGPIYGGANRGATAGWAILCVEYSP